MTTTKELTMSDCTEAFAVPGQQSIADLIHPITGRSLFEGETLEEVRLRYPGAVRVVLADWLTAKAAAQDVPVQWLPVDEAKYDEMLNVLPPAAWRSGGFLVGEPWDHHATSGQPRFEAYIVRAGQYFASHRPVTRSEFLTLNP